MTDIPHDDTTEEPQPPEGKPATPHHEPGVDEDDTERANEWPEPSDDPDEEPSHPDATPEED